MVRTLLFGTLFVAAPVQAATGQCGATDLSTEALLYDIGKTSEFLVQSPPSLGEVALGKDGPYLSDWQPYVLNGIPESPFYDKWHAGNNAHIHLSFLDVEKATEAVEFLTSLTNPYTGRPIRIWEWTKGPGGVRFKHSDQGHYDGRAFDIPMDQAPVGKEVDLQRWIMKRLNGWLHEKGVPAAGLSTTG